MPIMGLTDRKSAAPRATRIAKLRKGERHGKKLVDLDYFRYIPQRGYEEAQQAFYDVYGSEPRQINVVLPYKTLEENWQTWVEVWGQSKGLIWRGNGEYLVRWLKDDMTYENDPDCQQRKPQPEGGAMVGRLSLVIQELYVIGFAGYVVFEVTSKNDLASITRSLLDIEDKFSHNGRGMMGIPCVLRRNLDEIGVRFPKQSGEMHKGKSSKWMVHLDLAGDFARQQIAVSQRQALGYSAAALPAPEMIIDAEAVPMDEPFDNESATLSPPPPAGPDPDFEDGPLGEPVRPYSPEILRTIIQDSISKVRGRVSLGDKLNDFRFAVVANLAACFEQHPDQKRHLITEYLTGKASSKDLDDAEIKVLHKWLGAHKRDDGEWEVNPLSITEARAVAKQALKDAGQLSFLDDPDMAFAVNRFENLVGLLRDHEITVNRDNGWTVGQVEGAIEALNAALSAIENGDAVDNIRAELGTALAQI